VTAREPIPVLWRWQGHPPRRDPPSGRGRHTAALLGLDLKKNAIPPRETEFGHAGHFVVTFAGFLALLGATARVGARTGVALVAPSPSPASVPHATSLEGTAAREGRSCSDAERPGKDQPQRAGVDRW
jgi:hypothetical protein